MKRLSGFTIVELLIVIVVIGILVTVGIVSYGAITQNARDNTVISDADGIESEVTRYATQQNSGYYGSALSWFSGSGASTNIQFTPTSGNIVDVVADNNNYCVRVYNPSSATYRTLQTAYEKGSSSTSCTLLTASIAAGGPATLQTINSSNCPTTRTRAYDVRDNRSYWVQKLADNKCWMLTNLAYAGGGTSTYGDAKTLSNGTSSGTTTYTVAQYYVPSGANPTTEPTNPSTSTSGTGQYGYLYNWCAAMGVQVTAACANTTTPTPDTSVSICPSGWRLPTGTSVTGELSVLNNVINSGSTTSDLGLRTTWLSQYSGRWIGWLTSQNSDSYYWSSTQVSAIAVPILISSSTYVAPSSNEVKNYGFAIRCVAN